MAFRIVTPCLAVTVAFYLTLTLASQAQTVDESSSAVPKLPPAQRQLAPGLDGIRWGGTPAASKTTPAPANQLDINSTRNDPDAGGQVVTRRVKAEVWLWLNRIVKRKRDRSGPAIQLLDGNVAPNVKPQVVRLIEPDSNTRVSLLELEPKPGDSGICLNLILDLLPGGKIKADLGLEKSPAFVDRHREITIRYSTNYIVELNPEKQVIEIAGIVMPTNDSGAAGQSWFQRWFHKKKPELLTPRMIVKLTVESVSNWQAREPVDKSLGIRQSGLGRTSVVLTPGQRQPFRDLVTMSLQTPVYFITGRPGTTETIASSGYGPWRRQIGSSVFWVGEPATLGHRVSNRTSAWDPAWQTDFGGIDDPDRRTGFFPTSFVPKRNPFYVALPFNDLIPNLGHPPLDRLIPWSNHGPPHAGSLSLCQGAWIAVRNSAGRVCYAQWEDVGPFAADHWEYVFGNQRPHPNPNNGAGIDVSPAIRDYLGLHSLDVVDWRFMRKEEVPPGPWLYFGRDGTSASSHK